MNNGHTLIDAYCQANNFEHKNILSQRQTIRIWNSLTSWSWKRTANTNYEHVYSQWTKNSNNKRNVANFLIQFNRIELNAEYRHCRMLNAGKWWTVLTSNAINEWLNEWRQTKRGSENNCSQNQITNFIFNWFKRILFNFSSSFHSTNLQYILSNICWWLIQVRFFVSIYSTFRRWLGNSSLHIETHSNTCNKMKFILWFETFVVFHKSFIFFPFSSVVKRN